MEVRARGGGKGAEGRGGDGSVGRGWGEGERQGEGVGEWERKGGSDGSVGRWEVVMRVWVGGGGKKAEVGGRE